MGKLDDRSTLSFIGANSLWNRCDVERMVELGVVDVHRNLLVGRKQREKEGDIGLANQR